MNVDLFNQIKTFMSESLSIPIEKIEMNALLGEHLDMDSLDLVDIIIGFEELFDIFIAEEELPNMIFVKNIYDSVEYHLNNKD